MKIISVTAHPDDMEIACSGTLKKFKDQGAEIISVISVCPSAEDNPKRNQEIVQGELERSYAISGFEHRILQTDLHANGRPNLQVNNVTMTKLKQLLEPCDIAILPHPGDYHQDHKNTYELAWPIMRTMAKELWLMHVPPYCYYHTSLHGNLFHDISQQWNFKSSLLECFDSYLDQEHINKIKITNQFWGLRNHTQLCEAFTLVNKYVR